jgi:hypothetical protein
MSDEEKPQEVSVISEEEAQVTSKEEPAENEATDEVEEQQQQQQGNSVENTESGGTATVQEAQRDKRAPRQFRFSLSRENLTAFRRAIKTLGVMQEEATFFLSKKEGLSYRAMDP